MLEGEITFYVGDETYEATRGTFVFTPRGVPHSYTFETDVIRMLVLVASGGFEEFFWPPQFSKPAQAPELPPPEGPPDVPALVATLEQHGVEVVGPRSAGVAEAKGRDHGFAKQRTIDRCPRDTTVLDRG